MKKLDLNFIYSELNRISEWIKFAEQKSAFLSIYYTWLIGFLFNQKANILKKTETLKECEFLFYKLFLVFIWIVILLWLWFLFLAILPKIKNWLTNNKSLFYFWNVSNMNYIDYSKEVLKLSENDAKKQILEQLYTNSGIAHKKMIYIKYSTIMLVILFISIIILISIY